MIDEKLTAVAENVPQVYAAGQKSEYDRFWDDFQKNGNRTDYEQAFASPQWNDVTFKPKYDFILGGGYFGYQMFRRITVTNLAETLENQGVRLDTSGCETLGFMFQSSATQRIPEINCTGITNYSNGLEYAFYDCSKLKTIDKLVVTEELSYNQTFNYDYALENIVFEGVIGQNVYFGASPKLSRASIENIVDHLSATATGKTLTLSEAAVIAAYGNLDDEWTTIMSGKDNWTISLV